MGSEPAVRNLARADGNYDTCNEALTRVCGAYQIACDRWWEFRGSIRTHCAGALEFADISFSDGSVVRERRDEHYKGDQYFLIYQAAGSARMRQRGSEACLQPGDCTLIDSRFPSIFEIGPNFHQYSFHLPAQLVNERLGSRRVSLACVIPSGHGPGAVLSDTLRSVIRNASALEGTDLTASTLQLLFAALGISPGVGATIGPSDHRSLTLREITHYIDACLQEQELSPLSIANHFNTSVRRLYRIAGAGGCTPAALIWCRRLARARELLGQCDSHVPIIEIALSCGFKDGAHFSRAYRKAFGHPPNRERSLAMGATRQGAEAVTTPQCLNGGRPVAIQALF